MAYWHLLKLDTAGLLDDDISQTQEHCDANLALIVSIRKVHAPARSGEARGANGGFRADPIRPLAARMVKVFGCRQAYENRPCTNPRVCGGGLWGFQVLRSRCGFETGSVLELAGSW
jgi:hypothetical protein